LFQRRKYSLIDGWPEALNHYLLHDGSGLVDCDLDDDVTLNTLRVRPENRVRRYDRQGGANFWARIASIRERSVKRTGCRAAWAGRRDLVSNFQLRGWWLHAMRTFFFCRALPSEAWFRLVLRNPGVTSEVNASYGTARLASHHRGGSNEDRGWAVQKPSEE